jgi:hypothetical protein
VIAARVPAPGRLLPSFWRPASVPVGRKWPCSCCSDRKITHLGWSGNLGEDDGVAEGFQLADVVAHLAVLVDPAGVVAGAEVVVAGGAAGQQGQTITRWSGRW